MQLVSIQYLRALAALMVVVYHADAPLRRLGLATGEQSWLAAGVDVFFVISGLIMWITTAEHPSTPRDFWARRLIRIVPLYWVLTTAMVASTILVPGLARSAGFDPAHVIASYLFIPWPHPVVPAIFPVIIPGWTLNNEMFFYALFGLGLLLPARARFWAVGAALAGFVLAARLAPEEWFLLRFYGADIILDFWYGMAIGWAVRAGRLPGPRLGGVLLLGGLALLPGAWMLAESWPRGVVVGLPATLVVLGALALERAGRVPVRRLPLLLGDASYALYLVHGFVLAALAPVWRRVPDLGAASAVLFVLVGTVACCAVAVMLFRLVERPVRHLLHRLIPLRTGTGPVVPPPWSRRQARAE